MTKLSKDPPPPVISHWAHTAHDLSLVTTGGALFRCDGCMQPGYGHRYRCESCNFDLHTHCALADETVGHALFKKCTFTFHHEPPSGGRHCDACGDDVVGFVYHCSKPDLDLHPCCAQLPVRHVQDGQVFELRKEALGRCGFCGNNDGPRRKFWAYRSYYDGEVSYLHVACIWGAHRAQNIGSGGQIVLEGAPMMEGLLQSLPRNTRRSRGFNRFRKIVGVVVSVIIAVIFGNPMALITAVAGPSGLLRG